MGGRVNRMRLLRLGSWSVAAVLGLACHARGGVQPTPPPAEDDSLSRPALDCPVAQSDRDWLERSIAAWRETSDAITEIGGLERLRVVFFDATCVMTSDRAMLTGTSDRALWVAEPHDGRVRLPDGNEARTVTTAYARGSDGGPYFVMSMPSISQHEGVKGGVLGLGPLMTAVLLHEATHVLQMSTYGEALATVAEEYGLPESYGDDTVQERFEHDEAFSSSVAEEIELLFSAAAADNLGQTRRLAREARNKIRARHERWFVDDIAYFSKWEDLYLTLEGSAQWVGYTWVVGQVGERDALEGFGRRSKWWTQNQGLALFLVLDRLGFDWKKHAFADGGRTGLEMLDIAVSG